MLLAPVVDANWRALYRLYLANGGRVAGTTAGSTAAPFRVTCRAAITAAAAGRLSYFAIFALPFTLIAMILEPDFHLDMLFQVSSYSIQSLLNQLSNYKDKNLPALASTVSFVRDSLARER